MSATGLSAQDVARLLSDPSPQHRAETAEKLADGFEKGSLTAPERKLAEDIFRLMVKDAEERVRRVLSQHLKSCRDVPHEVAAALARDVESVAIPMLTYSEVLTDEDLIEIVKSQGEAHQTAIAGRAAVSERVSDALIDTGSAKVVETLVGNEGAAISDSSLDRVVEGFGSLPGVQDKLAHRAKLPIIVAEKLVTRVSENLRRYLMERSDISATLAADLVLQARERSILGLAGQSGDEDVEALVRQLHVNGRLAPSIILRAVCLGDLRFFEASLAQITGVPLVNTRILIHDSGPLGFKAVFNRAGLPEELFTVFNAAIEVARETKLDGEPRDRERYSRRMIERILTQYGDLGVKLGAEDLDYLLTKMSQLPSLALGKKESAPVLPA
jgi:uncharacterized protein (DUF2336 family)